MNKEKWENKNISIARDLINKFNVVLSSTNFIYIDTSYRTYINCLKLLALLPSLEISPKITLGEYDNEHNEYQGIVFCFGDVHRHLEITLIDDMYHFGFFDKDTGWHPKWRDDDPDLEERITDFVKWYKKEVDWDYLRDKWMKKNV